MMRRHDVSDSSDEEEMKSTPNKPEFTQNVLSQVVDDVAEYKAVREPGPLTQRHLTPNTELYLITIPKTLFDPMKLIHTEMVVGSSKEHGVCVGGQEYQMATYPVTPHTQPPPLFLPDKDGSLWKVDDDKLKGHIVFRSQPKTKEGLERIDIRSLCSKRHIPPSDLHPRNFFTSKPKVRKSIGKVGKGKKRKMEEEVEKEVESSPTKKKKKKSTNADTSFSSPFSDIKQEETHSSKKKKKKDKELGGQVIVKEEEEEEEVWSLSQKSRKGKKSEKKKEVDSYLVSPVKMEVMTPDNKSRKSEKKKKKLELEEENLNLSSKSFRKEKKMKFNSLPSRNESDNEKGYLSEDLFAESPKKKKKSKKGKHNLTL